MPPVRSKKTRQSNEAVPSNSTAMIPTQREEEAHTPDRTTASRQAGITQMQKQALIDNLQLEITERARKLRAQYAMQAQALRTRLDMRVNRIPQALRKRNMQDLLDEHTEKQKPAPAPPRHIAPAPPAKSPARRSLKRPIDHFGDENKENAPAASHDLPNNPKKRVKTAMAPNPKATRTISQKSVPSTVLSPRSANSRTLPKSPFKTVPSPEKSMFNRPPSPVKPAVPPRAASRTTKSAVPGSATYVEPGSRNSEASNSSAATTIVHKPAPPTKARAAARKGATATTAAASRKAVAKQEVAAPAPAAAAGRTLRKRG